MKILIATPYFYPRVGGLEHYAEAMALGLSKAGHDVHVVTSGTKTETVEHKGLQIHRLRSLVTVSNTPANPLWRFQIKRLVKQIRPDVINVHAPVPTMALAATAAAGAVPVVVTYHAGSMKKGKFIPDLAIAAYEKLLLPRMLNRASRIITASDFVKNSFLSHWQAKITTVTPGVDVDRFQPNRHAAGRNVVFIGDFRDPRKGLDILLGAMHQVPNSSLSVVGSGEPTWQAGVNFVGIKTGTDLVAQIQAADVLVLPSITDAESFGMVLVEAMACGIPVIGSNIGGIPTVIGDGKAGLLVEAGNSSDLALAINRILDTPSFARRLGNAGRIKAVSQFSWTSRVSQTAAVLSAAPYPLAAPAKVFFLHNVVAPYRLPVFEEVGKEVDLHVFFCKQKTKDRLWDVGLDGYNFNRKILPNFKFGPFFINPTLPWELIRHSYDVYLIGDFPETIFATLLTILAAKLRRRPLVLWSETIDNDVIYFQNLAVSNKPWNRLMVRVLTGFASAYRRILATQPDRFVALSAMAREFLIQEGVEDFRLDSGIQVMPSQLLDAPNMTKAKGPYAGKKVVLYVGYLNPMKGINCLIDAVQGLDDKNLRLVIVGSGPAEEELRAQAMTDLRIEFVGYKDGAEKANYMSWADVLVLPTLADCWALVVNESIYYGAPVITTEVAGASELLTGKRPAGLVVPVKDSLALQTAIRSVTSNKPLADRLKRSVKKLQPMVTDPRVGAEPIVAALIKAGDLV